MACCQAGQDPAPDVPGGASQNTRWTEITAVRPHQTPSRPPTHATGLVIPPVEMRPLARLPLPFPSRATTHRTVGGMLGGVRSPLARS